MRVDTVGAEQAQRTGLRPSLSQRIRFSAVDEAAYLLDSVWEPWSVHVEARVHAALDESRLAAAVAAALARHPMARARKAVSGIRASLEWELLPEAEMDVLQVVQAPSDDALDAVRADLQSLFVPLNEAPPLRVWLVHHPGGDVVMLNVNHAAADGIGSLRILRSIARAYAAQADPVPDLDPLCMRDPAAFLARVNSQRSVRRGLRLFRELGEAVGTWTRVAAEEGKDRPGYGLHLVALTPEQTTAVAEGRRVGVTINDLLIAALHLAVDGWNAEHRMSAGRIGVVMPVNLRPRAWWHEVVGNFSLMVPVASSPGDRDDPAAILAAVSRRTRLVKQDHRAALLLGLLTRVQRLPARLRRALAWLFSRDQLMQTAMLSNLGGIDEPLCFGPEVGEAVEVWFSPPAKMPLGLGLGAVTAAGRLHLVFRYRHPLFSKQAAARFADRYVTVLLALCEHDEENPNWPPVDGLGAPFGRKRQRGSGWNELPAPNRVTGRPAGKVSP